MKKAVFSFLFLMIITSSIQAQSGLRFGIVVNPHISWISSDVKFEKNDGSVMGISYGLSLDNYFTDNYAFSTGLLLNHTGGKLKFDSDGDTVYFYHSGIHDTLQDGISMRYKLQYLQIPLALKFKTEEIGMFTYYAQVGLTPQFNLKAIGSSTADLVDHEKISEEVNVMSLGYHIGGGIEYTLQGSTAITVGILYTNGFVDITSDEAGRHEAKSVLNCFELKLGVLF